MAVRKSSWKTSAKDAIKRAPVGTARCCAGFPSPAEQYQEPLGLRLPSKADAFSADILDLNELLVKRPAATYFVRVEGDSMVGAEISEISPERSEHCEAMSLEGCDFTVKTYRRDKSGVRLEPANPNYPIIRLRAGQELDYFGKVTACIHRFAGKR